MTWGCLSSDPSSTEQRVAVLAATPGQLLGVVLQDYKRARLNELCLALGFSDAGKEMGGELEEEIAQPRLSALAQEQCPSSS